MDIQLLADKINLNTKLKNKVLSLVDKDRAKLIYLCNIAKSGDFKSLFVKNDLTKLAIALMYSAEITYPKYKRTNISDDIYFDTMKDIAVWCENNNNKGLKNLAWIKNHLNFELFKIGRLQFQIYKCHNRTLNYDLLPFNFGENLKKQNPFLHSIFSIINLNISFVKVGCYMAKIGGLWIVQAIFCSFHHCLIWYIRLKMTGRRLNAFLEKEKL